MVLKFGGTSVASARGWRAIATASQRTVAQGHRAVVVCSAVSGVSNQLEALLARATSGDDVSDGVVELRRVHEQLAADLGVTLPGEVSDALDELDQALRGVALVRDASPKVHARILASGELMSTHLGVAWLQAEGLPARWADARAVLAASDPPSASEGRRYLSASVDASPSPEARRRLPNAPIVVTQGFIAADERGHTVLLGRGGSDTSAALFGVCLDARRVEIWTDVPGLFSANPSTVPHARHLARLGYEEVAAMAALGAKVLHPRCVGPLCEAEIPLHVKCTYAPENPGTVVSSPRGRTGIKAVTARRGLVMLKMCRPSQWQPVGFVADISAVFKRHDLSIDLMATSPSTIAATVDPSSAPRASLDALVRDLDDVCDVEVRRPMASVSLVGSDVRRTLDRVGGAIQQVDGVAIEMVAQGASDHHLTVVVEDDAADALVEALHAALFTGGGVPRWPLRVTRGAPEVRA